MKKCVNQGANVKGSKCYSITKQIEPFGIHPLKYAIAKMIACEILGEKMALTHHYRHVACSCFDMYIQTILYTCTLCRKNRAYIIHMY